MNKQEARQKLIIEQFEEIKEIAELKTLSNLSLEKPLTDNQFKRMKELFNKYYGKIK